MAKLIPYKNKWICSYETLKFDTSDGDLDFGQYAKTKGGYYIRLKPKDKAQFNRVKLDYDVSELTEIKILDGHNYYNKFRKADGKIIRIQTTGKKYWDTARIKNYPQPKRIEMVTEIPVFPEDSKSSKHRSIGFNAASTSGYEYTVTSMSWPHTCTGNNRILVVGDSHTSTDWGNGFATVSEITYNAEPMAALRDPPEYTDANLEDEYSVNTVYYLVAPDADSAYTVAVSYNIPTLSEVAHVVCGAVSYTGAAQTGQPDAHNGAIGDSGSNPSVAVTTGEDNCWVISVVTIRHWGQPCTVSSDDEERWNENDGGVNYLFSGGGSDINAPTTPAGSQTISWTVTDLAMWNWAITVMSIAPVAVPSVSKDLQTKGNILRTYKQDLKSKANILASSLTNIQSKANLFVRSQNNLQTKANVGVITQLDLKIKANLSVVECQDLGSKGEIFLLQLKDLKSKSNISVATKKYLQSKADITVEFVIYKKDLSLKGSILLDIPDLISPVDLSSEASPITFVWTLPTNYQSNIHSHIQIDKTSNAFGDIEEKKKSHIDSGFEYWNGDNWVTYPASGVNPIYGGNQARISVSLTDGDKWWRVRCGIDW